jgi:putative zinc finger/helix-turn-helix YgiT family protein
MLNRCPNCNATKLVRRSVERIRHVAGHAFAARLPAQVCESCGETFFSDDAVTAFDLAVAAKLAGAGIVTADALKFMRKVTGLNGKEFAELLEVRPETVSRWEQDKRPIDRATYAIIRQLIFDRLHGSSVMADFLRSLRKPKHLPRRVRVDLHDAA